MIQAVSFSRSFVNPAFTRSFQSPRFGGQLPPEKIGDVVGEFQRNGIDRLTQFDIGQFTKVPASCWYEFTAADENKNDSLSTVVRRALKQLEKHLDAPFGVIWLHNNQQKINLGGMQYTVYDGQDKVIPEREIPERLGEAKLIDMQEAVLMSDMPANCKLRSFKVQKPVPMGFILVYPERPTYTEYVVPSPN